MLVEATLPSPVGSVALSKQPAFSLCAPCSPARKPTRARAYTPPSSMGLLGFNFQLKDQVGRTCSRGLQPRVWEPAL